MRYYNLSEVRKDKNGNTQDIIWEEDFTNRIVLKRWIIAAKKNLDPKNVLDVMVYDGTPDDKHANYRMTLDPNTLEDKGY